jgi:hypothetical protein
VTRSSCGEEIDDALKIDGGTRGLQASPGKGSFSPFSRRSAEAPMNACFGHFGLALECRLSPIPERERREEQVLADRMRGHCEAPARVERGGMLGAETNADRGGESDRIVGGQKAEESVGPEADPVAPIDLVERRGHDAADRTKKALTAKKPMCAVSRAPTRCESTTITARTKRNVPVKGSAPFSLEPPAKAENWPRLSSFP